jgi:hypothetical protein
MRDGNETRTSRTAERQSNDSATVRQFRTCCENFLENFIENFTRLFPLFLAILAIEGREEWKEAP